MNKNIIIHVITGDGKGKTTASLGLALRAIGAGKRVKMIQFMKKPVFSEHKAIKKYGLPIEIEAYGVGFYKILGDTQTDEAHQKAAYRALEGARKAILSTKYDLIILDEINVAIGFGLLKVDDILNLISEAKQIKRKQRFDLVLTGRRAPLKLKKIADLVSEIKNIKNYFDQGIEAEKGIEY